MQVMIFIKTYKKKLKQLSKLVHDQYQIKG